MVEINADLICISLNFNSICKKCHFVLKFTRGDFDHDNGD